MIGVEYSDLLNVYVMWLMIGVEFKIGVDNATLW